MNKVTQDGLVARDWPLQGSDGWRFPHAVLEVRQEGLVTNDLITLLDKSHLVCLSLEHLSVCYALTDYRLSASRAFR